MHNSDLYSLFSGVYLLEGSIHEITMHSDLNIQTITLTMF